LRYSNYEDGTLLGEPEQLFVSDGVHAEQLREADDFLLARVSGVDLEVQAVLFLAFVVVVQVVHGFQLAST